MRYHDTGSKDASHALATWFEEVLSDDVSEFRMQTGYFSFDAVRAIGGFLGKAVANNLLTSFVIGSNEGDTLHSDLSRLALKAGIPRVNARLAVVNFGNALFHPKVYHIRRSDGSQAAFVGSANFTAPGLTGSNVEAALSVDTKNGDSENLLTEIREAIDKWFGEDASAGVTLVQSQETLDQLLESGLLATARPPRTSSQKPTGGGTPPNAKRAKLVKLPPWPEEDTDLDVEEATAADEPPVEAEAGAPAVEPTQTVPPADEQEEATQNEIDLLPVEARPGFPEYILFQPGATGPTSGWSAMSGRPLPNSAVGLILRLTKDSARHFKGGKGTANISIPVAVIKTFRFGVLPGSGRPRAEMQLRMRYYSPTLVVEQDATTNVMAYGFMADETGHGDLRMVVPAAVKRIAEEVKSQAQQVPDEGDLFLLEWPNAQNESFGITFFGPGAPVAEQVAALYDSANSKGQLVGGAYWLPAELPPPW